MGNILRKRMAYFKFIKETFKVPYIKGEMGIHKFESDANKLTYNLVIKIAALLVEAIHGSNSIIAYIDKEASNENKIVFYDLFNESDRYMLVDGVISALSDNCVLDVDKINRDSKDLLTKISEFYKEVYALVGELKSIPLTDKLSYRYGLFSTCHYAVAVKNNEVYEIREMDYEYLEEETDNKFNINRGLETMTIAQDYVEELESIRESLLDLIDKYNLGNAVGLKQSSSEMMSLK